MPEQKRGVWRKDEKRRRGCQCHQGIVKDLFWSDFGYVLIKTSISSTAPSWKTEIDTWLMTHVYTHFSKFICVFEKS